MMKSIPLLGGSQNLGISPLLGTDLDKSIRIDGLAFTRCQIRNAIQKSMPNILK
jgi:hypothetical protein